MTNLTQSIEATPTASSAAKPVSHPTGTKRPRATAKRGQKATGATGRHGLSFLGAVLLGVVASYGAVVGVVLTMLLGGCDLIYMPDCDYDCAAAAGDDAYGGRAAPASDAPNVYNLPVE